MKKEIKNVKISGTGSYVPDTRVTNQELELRTQTSDTWIYQNLGIKERRIVSDELTSDLAANAALQALASARLRAEDIDLLIVATATPDLLAPSTACIVQEKIKAWNAVAFDLSAVCSGFLFAFSTASQFIASGTYERVLVIGADTFSKVTDWSRRDCVFFGDGAGAVVLTTNDSDKGMLNFRLHTDGRGKMNFTIPVGEYEPAMAEHNGSNGFTSFQMNGPAVFETATRVLPDAITEVLNDSGVAVDEVSLLIPHQPGIRILKETARKIGMPFEKVMTNMEKYANTSAGTIPIMLDETYRAGKIRPGDLVLFAAVGSGWNWGAALLRWA